METFRNFRHAERDSDYRRYDDSDKNRAWNFERIKRDCDDKPDERDDCRSVLHIQVDERKRSRSVPVDNSGVRQTDERYEKPDSDGDSFPQVDGNRFYDCLADSEKRQYDEKRAFKENGGQRECRRAFHSQNDSVREERVQPQSWRERDRKVRGKSHDKRRHARAERRRRENAAPRKPRSGKIARIDGKNVAHREECRYSSDDFAVHGRFPRVQLEN